MSNHSSPFPACFRTSTATITATTATTTATTATIDRHKSPAPPPPPPPSSGNTNLITCLYHTDLGLFSLTWSRSLLGRRSLHLHLHPFDFSSAATSPLSLSTSPLSLSSQSFHLHIKPFIFWKKHGSKKLTTAASAGTGGSKIQVFWDLTKAKFGSGPEPQSGFYIAVTVDGEMILLVGDSNKEAYSKTKAQKPERIPILVLRREHVFGNKIYKTKARLGGKYREITIDCNVNEDARLCFSVDDKKVLQIKRLKWKFRGNERIEVDGVPIQISWDVYNWFFDDNHDGHAVFMFRFEKLGFEEEHDEEEDNEVAGKKKSGVVLWMNGIEWRKMMRKSLLRTARSSSSSSMSASSASSGGGSSVMEWASTEENEPNGPTGFSLLVYAWKK